MTINKIIRWIKSIGCKHRYIRPSILGDGTVKVECARCGKYIDGYVYISLDNPQRVVDWSN